MIVVSGWLRVEPSDRDAYLAGSRAVIETARTTPGCVDFSLSADLVDADRINIFEQWDSVEAVERFRGSGPSDDQQAVITGAHVVQQTVTDTVELT
jgi:quinol monooxygenase YgiN